MKTIEIDNDRNETISLTQNQIRNLLFFTEVLFFYMEQKEVIHQRLHRFLEKLYPEPNIFWLEHEEHNINNILQEYADRQQIKEDDCQHCDTEDNVHYKISIEHHSKAWVGTLDKVSNYNIQPRGQISCEQEVSAASYIELYMNMFEAGFFAKMAENRA